MLTVTLYGRANAKKFLEISRQLLQIVIDDKTMYILRNGVCYIRCLRCRHQTKRDTSALCCTPFSHVTEIIAKLK